MKLIHNKTKRLLFVGRTMIKPGVSVMPDDFDLDTADMEAWQKARMVKCYPDASNIDAETLGELVESCYDNETVKVLAGIKPKDGELQDKAEEQAKENDRKSEELDKAIEEAKAKEKGKK